MAAGGRRLAVKGGDPREMLATCGSCTIPKESARRPCLYLLPIKTERDSQVRDYFLCRWFYTLKPEEPATKTDWMCVAEDDPVPPGRLGGTHHAKAPRVLARPVVSTHSPMEALPAPRVLAMVGDEAMKLLLVSDIHAN
ncbi:MAG: hypothetical protein HYT85_09805 [candidate division NC10 bacterium]|nr:hypothetical protein [candidate division NC10 bacterium]